ncbi:hypothetical protein [Burkholderia vietnamiensis]|uniref:hypothetical protein n=1 Tax=Burkholderia vietnamiensis TaxID=60552 RepID=UPI002655FA9A|nr:hypothetical protein [Burkholderia vietnamiensis]MDN7670311.1 hypothetical protein [Burkholderia vietnamiensis]
MKKDARASPATGHGGSIDDSVFRARAQEARAASRPRIASEHAGSPAAAGTGDFPGHIAARADAPASVIDDPISRKYAASG